MEAAQSIRTVVTPQTPVAIGIPIQGPTLAAFNFQIQTLKSPDLSVALQDLLTVTSLKPAIIAGTPIPAEVESAKLILSLLSRPGLLGRLENRIRSSLGENAYQTLESAALRIQEGKLRSSPGARALETFDKDQAARTFDGSGPAVPAQDASSPPVSPTPAAGSPRPLRLIITGPPGSGKGTYSAKIAQEYGVVHISVGELLRIYAQTHPQVASIMAAGKLVDSKLVLDVVRQRLAQPDIGARGFIIDGFPRRIEEAAALQDMLGEAGVDGVIELHVPEAELQRRILARGRADDKPDVFQERMKIYREVTVPAVESFKSVAPVFVPDVSGSSIETNYARVKAALGGLLDRFDAKLAKSVSEESQGALPADTHSVIGQTYRKLADISTNSAFFVWLAWLASTLLRHEGIGTHNVLMQHGSNFFFTFVLLAISHSRLSKTWPELRSWFTVLAMAAGAAINWLEEISPGLSLNRAFVGADWPDFLSGMLACVAYLCLVLAIEILHKRGSTGHQTSRVTRK